MLIACQPILVTNVFVMLDILVKTAKVRRRHDFAGIIVPYHTIPTIQYHTIPYHMPYHTIRYHTTPHNTTPCTTLHHTITLPYHILPCLALPCSALPCPALPCLALPCPASYKHILYIEVLMEAYIHYYLVTGLAI